ncbi:GGDEF domain-containing protein [Qipengyuania qiaonensis]|uniref:diguanylate cyclase n=1 Tax=Qipengyuania qiaonensis TaxID=2867240 RepID=A0ABS7JCL6_9SPHN|nr:diguanylate cyclase [Qipengyuania qiaonensis]MBX7483584.1 diguanylate cyclase [Qipengyuania qiaonensis]
MWIAKQLVRRTNRSDWRSYFLIACVALLALLLAGASWSAFRSSQERSAAREWQVHTLEVLLEADQLRTASLQQLRGERGFLLTNDEEFLEPYYDGRANTTNSYARLLELTADNPEQQQRLANMRNEFHTLNTVLEAMIEHQQTGRHEEAIFYIRRRNDKDAIEAILREIEGLMTVERQLLQERNHLAHVRATSNERYQYILAAVGLLLLALSIFATFFVRRALAAENAARRELQRVASTDMLTALPNRRSFMEALERSIARAEADPTRTLSVAIFDIDHFKRINDRFGHPAGDAVIREVGVRALSALRKRDLVGRIGGEEFAVILPRADMETARIVCERLREAIAGSPVVACDSIIPFTASIGIAEFQAGDEIDHLMARADAALYDAKTGGRNQVRLAA